MKSAGLLQLHVPETLYYDLIQRKKMTSKLDENKHCVYLPNTSTFCIQIS